jgi:hypothetical protein
VDPARPVRRGRATRAAAIGQVRLRRGAHARRRHDPAARRYAVYEHLGSSSSSAARIGVGEEASRHCGVGGTLEDAIAELRAFPTGPGTDRFFRLTRGVDCAMWRRDSDAAIVEGPDAGERVGEAGVPRRAVSVRIHSRPCAERCGSTPAPDTPRTWRVERLARSRGR